MDKDKYKDTKFEHLSGEYIRGYTNAIMHIQEVINYIIDDLADHHKKLNNKSIVKLIDCCLKNRENLRENVFKENQGFIRYNCISNEFEWFVNKNKKR